MTPASRLRAEKRKAKAKRINKPKALFASDGQPVRVRGGMRHAKLEALLQKELNAAIRERDGLICITCGRYTSPGNTDAGHMLPVKSHPEVRFHPWNIHSQCSMPCNRWNGGEGTIYAEKFKARYGLAAYIAIIALVGTPLRLSMPDLQSLRDTLRTGGIEAYTERYFRTTGWDYR